LITWLVGPVVRKAGLPSSLQAGFACLADGLAPRLRRADRPLIADTADASVRVAKHARNSMGCAPGPGPSIDSPHRRQSGRGMFDLYSDRSATPGDPLVFAVVGLNGGAVGFRRWRGGWNVHAGNGSRCLW
jgi:hypothetical protein